MKGKTLKCILKQKKLDKNKLMLTTYFRVFLLKNKTCVSFLYACTAFLLYLDDVTYAVLKKGLVILVWYFGEGMETHKEGKKVKKERNVEIVFRNCVYTQ